MAVANHHPSSSKAINNPPQIPGETTSLISKSTPLSSQPKAFANIFIAIVGAGVLGYPYTFKKTGWIMALTMLFSVGFLTYYCMMLLVYTRRKLESLNGNMITSFGDLGFIVCGSTGRVLVDTLILLSQSGFCVGYLIFIGNSLADLFNSPTSKDLHPRILGLLPKRVYIWACFPLQLGLNSVKTLTHLAPLSIFADVIDIGAMGIVMIQDLVVLVKNNAHNVVAFGGLSSFCYGVGVFIYSFEGAGMVLPLESETKDKKRFGRTLAISMFVIVIMYGAFGTLSYFAYGEATKDIITSNMGKGWLSCLVKLGLCLNLFFTFPLMMNPVFEVVERRFCEGRYCLWLRWLLVLAVTLVALFVPNFADFLSLAGSSVCCSLGFVLPALFHLITFRREMDWKGVGADVGILILGIVFGSLGTWYSLLQIFSDFGGED